MKGDGNGGRRTRSNFLLCGGSIVKPPPGTAAETLTYGIRGTLALLRHPAYLTLASEAMKRKSGKVSETSCNYKL